MRRMTTRSTALRALLIVLIAFLAYLPALHNGYIWDDDAYVVNNRQLTSLEGLKRIWLTPEASPQYYPMVFTVFWGEYHLWQLRPAGYHFVNVLVHALAAIMLWLLLARLNIGPAWFVAALFAVHPVQVETVAWITELKNTLSAFFALTAAHSLTGFFLSEAETGSRGIAAQWKGYWFGLACFILALLSKTVTATMPAVLLIILWWKTDRITKRQAFLLLPFFLVGAAFGLSTAWLEKHHVGAEGAEWSLSFVERFLVAGRALWFYAEKLLWPHHLVFIYRRWHVSQAVWWQYLYPAAFLVAVAAAWFSRNRIGRGPFAAILIFGGSLFPALGFLNVFPHRYSYVADHFQYLAGIALLVLVVSASAEIARRLKIPRMTIMIAGCTVLLLFGGLTWNRCAAYENAETLWIDTIARNPDAAIAFNNLGVIRQHQGRFGEAIALFQESLRLKPKDPEAITNIGSTLIESGNAAAAVPYLELGLSENPQHFALNYNMGMALENIGRYREAVGYYAEAIRANPGAAKVRNNLGVALAKLGRISEAEEQFREALRLDPAYDRARGNLDALQRRK